jgi:beta-glucanase (GH16 family)
MNSYCGGVYQQAVSGLSNLNNQWYDGQSYQTYAFEYTPGSDGTITWYIGSTPTWTLDARAIGPNGNIGQRVIPQEPMAMVINFGMSNGFSALNLTGLEPLMPATMRVDYLRIYQDEGSEMVTCDPPGYPTTDYIKEHPIPYNNPNLTHW